MPKPSPERRFPPPWSVIERAEAFLVEDADGQRLASVHHRDDEHQGTPTEHLSRDEARRLAANIARLPFLLFRDGERRQALTAGAIVQTALEGAARMAGPVKGGWMEPAEVEELIAIAARNAYAHAATIAGQQDIGRDQVTAKLANLAAPPGKGRAR